MVLTSPNEGEDLPKTTSTYVASKWALPYISKAIQLGWISKTDFIDNKKTISTEQAAYILGKAFVSYGTECI